MKTFEKVAPYLKKRIYRYLIAFFVLITVDVVQLFIPKIIQRTVDQISNLTIDKTHILHAALLIIGMSVIMAVMRFFWRYLVMGNSRYFEFQLRQDFYDHLMKLSQNYYNKSSIGDFMAKVTNDLNAIRMFFAMGFVAAADILILSTASFIFMINISPKLTFISIIPLPIMSIVIVFAGKKMHKEFKLAQKIYSSMSGKIQESLSGIRVVKAFNQEKFEMSRINKDSKDYVNKNLQLAVIMGFFHPFMTMIIGISMGLALIFGGYYTVTGSITIGKFIAFFSYLGTLAWPMIAIGWFINLYQRGTASLKRLNDVYQVKPEITDECADNKISKILGNFEVKNLTFRYKKNSDKIFNDISLNVNKSETLAIVGRTASGKSTLLELFSRIYNPPKNTIFLDGYDVHNIPLQILRKNIITVPQEIFLFSDTIMNNLKFGDKNISDEKVYEITKKVQIYDEILNFKDGFKTLVGEKGVTLSGGQKQRIGIARALLLNPQILIFDDSLSAVDTKTEKNILEHLINIRKNKTTIIVAHRISSIQHADKIIVIHNKEIIEEGTHEELLGNDEFYKEIFDMQQIESKIEGK